MTHNPYSPPATRVDDLRADGPVTGVDRDVFRACKLMWWSFGAALLAAALHFALSSDKSSIVARAIVAAIVSALAFLLTRWTTAKLKAGRNWMRLLITLLQIGGLPLIPLFWSFYKPILISQYGGNPAYAVASGAQWILNLSAAVLINTPSARSWFATMKRGARN